MIPRRQQTGVALITAMLIVALAAVIGAGMLTQMNLALHRSSYIWHSEQAMWYGIGIENWLGVMLRTDAQHSDTDNLQELWAEPVDYLPLEGGALSGRLTDLQGRFNLNNLAGNNSEQALALFTRLIARVLDTDPVTAQTIAASSKDWIDSDIQPTGPYGAEDNYYLGLDPDYRTGNTAMVSPTELRLVRGVTADIYAALAPYISALPQVTPINVNTAPAALLGVLAPGLPPDTGEKLAAVRDEEPWGSVKQFLQDDLLAGRDFDTSLLAVSTHYFLASGQITVGESQYRFYSTLMRGNNGTVRVIAHSTNTY